jgi:5-(carboxyamino)imidazole ribonucleotide synthase
MNPLKTKIGILGGGQLGRMMIEEALRLNLHINILESDPNCPSAKFATQFIEGSIQDEAKIRELAAISDVLTIEIEHVNINALLQLEKEGKTIIPSPKILAIIQDKGLQKLFFEAKKIPTSPFALVNNPSEWVNALKQLNADKVAAKTRRDGYDGKGVQLIAVENILNGSEKIPFEQACVLEKFVACEKEIAIIVARDLNGEMTTFPIVEMEFDAEANLVTYLVCPAHLSEEIEEKATEIAKNCVAALDGIGIFAIELFVSKTGEVLVNEIAPRAHNSGHHTIEANYTSQFEQLLRILAGLPMGSSELIQPAIMMNILGANLVEGSYQLKGIETAMQTEGVYIHLYDKKTTKPMRKMGHVTVLGETVADAHLKAAYIKQILHIAKDEAL